MLRLMLVSCIADGFCARRCLPLAWASGLGLHMHFGALFCRAARDLSVVDRCSCFSRLHVVVGGVVHIPAGISSRPWSGKSPSLLRCRLLGYFAFCHSQGMRRGRCRACLLQSGARRLSPLWIVLVCCVVGVVIVPCQMLEPRFWRFRVLAITGVVPGPTAAVDRSGSGGTSSSLCSATGDPVRRDVAPSPDGAGPHVPARSRSGSVRGRCRVVRGALAADRQRLWQHRLR